MTEVPTKMNEQKDTNEYTKQLSELDDYLLQIKEQIKIFMNDESLKDLPNNITLDEIQLYIDREHSEAFKLHIKKFTDVLVRKDGNVRSLKTSIEQTFLHFPIIEQKHISWKYIWKKFSLITESGLVLLDNKKKLSEYDIHDNDTLSFYRIPIKKKPKTDTNNINKRRNNRNNRNNKNQNWMNSISNTSYTMPYINSYTYPNTNYTPYTNR